MKILYSVFFCISSRVQDFVFQVANEVADEWSVLLEEQKLPLSVYAYEFALKATLYTLFGKHMRDEVEIQTFKRKYDEVRSVQTFTERGKPFEIVSYYQFLIRKRSK